MNAKSGLPERDSRRDCLLGQAMSTPPDQPLRPGDPEVVETERLGADDAWGETFASQLPLILTVDELAQLLRVNRKTVYASIKAREIPGVRQVRGVIRIHRDTVLAWLAEGQARVPRPRRKP